MGLLDSAKDIGIQVVANRLLTGIGEVRSLNIDRTARRITCEVELKGESRPIEVSVSGWELGDSGIRVLAFAADRPWLNALASKTIVGRWFEVPPEHMGKVKLALG